MTATFLTINSGSSSIRFALYTSGDSLQVKMAGKIERIGLGNALISMTQMGENSCVKQPIHAPDHDAASNLLIKELERQIEIRDVMAIGHRVVHGGMRYSEPSLITPELIER